MTEDPHNRSQLCNPFAAPRSQDIVDGDSNEHIWHLGILEEKPNPLVPVESVLNNGVFSIGAAAFGI